MNSRRQLISLRFDLYNRAKNLLELRLSSGLKANLLEAVDLLNQAVARDPSFLQAYCQLAYAHEQLYFLGFDHTPTRLALAEAAIERGISTFVRMQVKPILRMREIFIMGTSITVALWLNWMLRGRRCLMMRGYFG